jgi:hypothetical protein
MKTKQVYAFKRGQKVHLDEIYMIQGLDNDWFEEDYSTTGAGSRKGLTDFLIITKDIKFTIIIESKES